MSLEPLIYTIGLIYIAACLRRSLAACGPYLAIAAYAVVTAFGVIIGCGGTFQPFRPEAPLLRRIEDAAENGDFTRKVSLTWTRC